MRHSLYASAFLSALVLPASLSAQSHWAHLDSHGKLVYAQTPKGDRIPDFSYAGYEGGGVALPKIATKRVLKPSSADDTANIQQAIDEVSALPLVDGFRGAVELAPGTFHCAKTLAITASGVVLRGAGNGYRGTTPGTSIVLTGPPHLALRIAGKLQQTDATAPTTITDAYVPAGASTFHVADASTLHAGDTVLISKPVTPTWVHFMGMDNMSRNGKPEQWVSASHLDVRRHIASVQSNTITLTVPLMDDYDTQFFEGARPEVRKIETTGQLDHVGIEDLRLQAPQRVIALGEPAFSGVNIRDIVDSWFRAVTLEDTTNGVSINNGTERMTFLQCEIIQHVAVTSHAKPADFASDGSQILFDRCTGSGDSTFYIVTQDRQQGPVVALHCRFTGNGHIEPHQRWSTGLLIDNCDLPGGEIDVMNRGEMGSGHGWAIGWAVVWNSTAVKFGMNTPPGSMIWSIGNRGEETDPPFPIYDGGPARAPLTPATIEFANKPVTPQSLYLEQLKERLGPQALKNIGY